RRPGDVPGPSRQLALQRGAHGVDVAGRDGARQPHDAVAPIDLGQGRGEDVTGVPHGRLLKSKHPAGSPRVAEAIRKLAAGRDPANTRKARVVEDGKVAPAATRVKPQRKTPGAHPGV